MSCPKVFTSPRAMSYVTSLMSGTPSLGTCTLSITLIRPTSASSFSCDLLPGETQTCADLRQLERGSLAEPPTITGYEHKHLAESKHLTEDTHFAEDKDLAEHADLRDKPVFFHRPTTASTCDSAESDFDAAQIRALLASTTVHAS